MDISRIHNMLEKLTERVENEIDNGLECVDTCEIGQAIDMIKDLSEALYYRQVVEAMKSASPDETVAMLESKNAYRVTKADE
jgi:hypothetical protein